MLCDCLVHIKQPFSTPAYTSNLHGLVLNPRISCLSGHATGSKLGIKSYDTPPSLQIMYCIYDCEGRNQYGNNPLFQPNQLGDRFLPMPHGHERISTPLAAFITILDETIASFQTRFVIDLFIVTIMSIRRA